MLLVFGSINFDIVVRVPHVPAPGETVLGSGAAFEAGGKGANQAHAARLFGVVTALVGAIGTDPFGEQALVHLRSAGVDLTRVQAVPEVPSGLACISVSATGENAIAVAPGANGWVTEEWVDDGTLAQCRAVLLQCEVPLRDSVALARRARRFGGVALMNPSPMPDQPLPAGAFDWLIVNATETRQLCSRLQIDGATPVERGQRLAAAQQCQVLMSMGADGAMLVRRDGSHVRCPALSGAAVDADLGTVVDTTGAGDTLAGVFAAALALGVPDAPALRYAVAASGLSCRREGTQVAQPDRARIEAAVAAWGAVLDISDA
jgi:ribokinase